MDSKKFLSSLLLLSLINTNLLSTSNPYANFLEDLKHENNNEPIVNHEEKEILISKKEENPYDSFLKDLRKNEKLDKEKKLKEEKLRKEKIKADKIKKKKLKEEKLRKEKIKADKIKADKLRKKKLKEERLRKEKIKADKIKANKLKKKKLKEEKLRKKRLAKEKAIADENKKILELAIIEENKRKEEKRLKEKAIADENKKILENTIEEEKRLAREKEIEEKLKAEQEEVEYFNINNKEYYNIITRLDINNYRFNDRIVLVSKDKKEICIESSIFEELNTINLNNFITYDDIKYTCISDTKSKITIDANYETGILKVGLYPFYFKVQTLNKMKDSLKYKDFSSSNGVRLDYDFYHMSTQNTGSLTSLLLSPNVFTEYGATFRTSHILKRDYNNDFTTTRLETFCRYDDVEKLQTYIVGDFITNSGYNSNSFRGVGVQFKKNFEIRPDLITYPTFSLSSQANLPSTVDLFINNVKRFQQKVNEGPIQMDYNNGLNGAGTATMLVRDETGKEKRIDLNFYTERKLLEKNLSDYSVSFGKLRRNYATPDKDSYDDIMLNTIYKRGITNTITAETQINIIGADTMFNFAGHYLFKDLFTTSASYAHIFNESNTNLYKFGVQRQTNKYNLLFTQEFSDDYLENSDTFNFVKDRTILNASYVFDDRYGTLQSTFIKQTDKNREKSTIFTLGYSKIFLKNIYGNIRYSYNIEPEKNHILSFLVNIPIDKENTYTSSFNSVTDKDGTDLGVVIQKNKKDLLDIGYNAEIRRDKNNNKSFRTTVSKTFEKVGVYGESGINKDQGVYVGGSVKGSLVYMNDEFEISRDLGQSFAMIEIEGVSDSEVKANGQYSGRTDKDGRVFVSNLTPYTKNRIDMDEKSIPLNVSLDSNQKFVLPRFDSGSILRFSRIINKSVVFDIKVDDEVNLDGYQVKVINEESKEEYSGIIYDNEIYLENIGIGKNTFIIDTKEVKCKFIKTIIDNGEMLDELKTEDCRK